MERDKDFRKTPSTTYSIPRRLLDENEEIPKCFLLSRCYFFFLPPLGFGSAVFSKIGVAGAEHCREFGDFHFASFLFARFFEVAVIAHFF